MGHSLIAESLACERNGRVVFSSLSFTINPGECAELRGANGAGKSSLLRMVAGLVPLAQGALRYGDISEIGQLCHYAGHLEGLKPSLTVAENLQFWAACYNAGDWSKALSVFSLDDLKDEPAQILSAGQRRRLALSRLFLVDRPLWLLDEPMTALDSASQDILRDCMKTHLKRDGLIMVATHGDLGFVPHQVISL